MKIGMVVKKLEGNRYLHIVDRIAGGWCQISTDALRSYCKQDEVEVQPYPFVIKLKDGGFVAAHEVTVMLEDNDPSNP